MLTEFEIHLDRISILISTMTFGKNSYELELTLFTWGESRFCLYFVNCTLDLQALWLDTEKKNPQSSDLIIWLVEKETEVARWFLPIVECIECLGKEGRGGLQASRYPTRSHRELSYVTRVERRKVAVWRNFISVVGKDFSEAVIFKKAILKIWMCEVLHTVVQQCTEHL